MDLEPAVIRSIKHFKRSKVIQRFLAFLPLLIAIPLYSVYVAYVYNHHFTKAKPILEDYWFAFEFISIVVLLGYIILRALDASRFSKWFAANAYYEGHPQLARFRAALEAVSIGAGITAPQVAVMEPKMLFRLLHADSETISFTSGIAKADQVRATIPFLGIRIFHVTLWGRQSRSS